MNEHLLNNLVVISKTNEEKKRLSTIVESLKDTFSSNVIFAEEEHQIYPNLAPDLPLYILLGTNPSSNIPLLKTLKPYTERIIVFSEDSNSYSQIAELLNEVTPKVTDVQFARTKAWRRALKKVFEVPMYGEELKKITSIQISYSGTPAEALYLQAFIATKLQWEFENKEEKGKTFSIHYKGDRHIILTPTETTLSSIFSMNILTSNDVHFLITHENDKHFVKVYISTKEQCEIPYTIYFSNYESGVRLIHEILYAPLSESFAKVVDHLAELEH